MPLPCIYGTYLASPNTLKRGYIKLFFEHLYVANKRIAKVTYNPLFATLLKEQKVMQAQQKAQITARVVTKTQPTRTEAIQPQEVILSQTKLPLIDMFRKREIGIDISLTNIKTLYETFSHVLI